MDVTTGRQLELAPPRMTWLRRAAGFVAGESVLIGVCALYVAFWAAAGSELIAADTWLTLLGGREIAQNGIPHADSLGVLSQGHEWIDQQWLAQTAFWRVERLGGLRLVVLFSSVLLAVPLVLAVAAARRRGASPAAVVPFAVFPALFFTSYLRAQLFSQLLFVALLLLLCSESRRPSRRVVLAFPLLALWANLHGAVVEGTALVAVLGASEAVRLVRRRSSDPSGWLRVAALTLGPWFCLLATPYGLASLDYYRSTLWNSALRQTQQEWMAPTSSALASLIVVPLAVAAVVLVARRRRELRLFEVAALGLTLAGALLATRSIVWFAYTSLVLLPALVQRGGAERPRALRGLSIGFAAAAAACAAAAVLVTVTAPASHVERNWPHGATAAVRAVADRDASARIFASSKYADWLLFELPALRGRVAFDGRWEVLSERQTLAIWRYLHQADEGTGSPARGYRLLVLDPQRERKLVHASVRDPRLRVLFRDRSVVVFERSRNHPAGGARRSALAR